MTRFNVLVLMAMFIVGARADDIVIENPGTNLSNTAPEVTRLQAGAQSVDIVYTLPIDDGDAGEQLQTNGAGVLTWEAAGGQGATVTLDLADDGSNESTALSELATIRDQDSVFTEPTADKVLIDVAKLRPVNFEQVLFNGDAGCLTATSYIGPVGSCDATETNVDWTVYGAITVTGLTCTQTQDTTCTVVATIRDDASDTAATCTTTNADTCNFSGSVAVAASSLVALKLVDSGATCTDGSRIFCAMTYTY